jgi:hypothetical protein
MQKVGDIIDFINNLGFATSILLPLQQLSVPFDSQAAVVKISPPNKSFTHKSLSEKMI